MIKNNRTLSGRYRGFTGAVRLRLRARAVSRLPAILFVLAMFCATGIRAENPAPGGEQLQRLSARGERELGGIVTAGRLKTLQQPKFGVYQAEIGAFYKSQGYTLAWVRNSRPTAKARIVIKRLQAAENEGLLARDYDCSLWKDRLVKLDLPGRTASESQLLRFDLELTVCAMRYILDLRLGRINPQPFHAAFDFEPDISGPSDLLRKRVLSADDVAAAFSALEPPFPSYRRLVKAVQTYEDLARRDNGGRLPASGRVIKPGDRYSGLPRLTSLLRLVGDLPAGAAAAPELYTGALVDAVKNFQRRHGLASDGLLGKETLRQLNVPLDQRLNQLRLTLERWRWLPHRFPSPPILVNIPEFRLYAGDEPSQRVVVGKAFEHQTPVFASRVTEVIFRPPWNVPLSIQRDEMVKEIEKNPSYLKEHDFEILDAGDSIVSSGTVTAADLNELREGKFRLRQRPGPHNSLGLVKFQVPNANSVYLHGTPSKRAFTEPERDLSHGCIRVEDPEALAAWVLRGMPGWTTERIRAAMGGEETVTVKLIEPIPVLIQYGTAVAEEGGEVRFFEDIYSRDAAEGTAFEQRERTAAR